jgi:non-ribosomal peptide synthetase component F
LPPVAREYRDYAEWLVALQSSGALEAQRLRWLGRLARLPPALALPTDFPRPSVACFAGAVSSFELERSSADGLRTLAGLHGVTLYTVLIALVRALLYRITGQAEFALGGSFADRVDDRIMGTLGFFVNPLTFAGVVRGDEAFSTALERERATVVEALEDGLYPFDSLLEELKLEPAPGRSPLFDVQVVLHANLQREPVIDGVRVETRLITTASRFDLVFNFRELGSGLVLELEYRTTLFSAARIELLCRRFARLAAQVGRDPEQILDGFELDERSGAPRSGERIFSVDLQR